LHDEIVDAHGDEVDADGVVPAGGDRNLQLRADAVSGRDQNRIAIAGRLRIEEGAEAPQGRRSAAARSGARQRLDRLDQRIPGVDVDSGGFVGEAVYGVLPGDAL
jgi:hypothetical protein